MSDGNIIQYSLDVAVKQIASQLIKRLETIKFNSITRNDSLLEQWESGRTVRSTHPEKMSKKYFDSLVQAQHSSLHTDQYDGIRNECQHINNILRNYFQRRSTDIPDSIEWVCYYNM